MARSSWLLVRGAGRSWRFALLCALAACGAGDGAPPDTASASRPAVVLSALPGLGKARPVDEGSRDPSLAAFRDTLLAVVARRDTAALYGFLVDDVSFSFGSDQGRDGFFKYWSEVEQRDQLWVLLRDVLEHGGRFSDPEFFSAPWTHTALPDSLDAYEHLIVRDSGVVVRERPDSSATALGTLSYDIVRAGGDVSDSVWRGVRLPDERVGYVGSRHIRSPIEYRIGLRRLDGRWRIAYFIAGD